MSKSILEKFKSKFSKKPKILVLKLSGIINYGIKEVNLFSKEKTSIESLMKIFDEITKFNKSDYKGILFRINSPGGSASASEELAKTIIRMKEKTGIPVVVSVANLACSGAYEVACTGDYIFANKSSLLGSIGAIINIPNYKELGEKIGYYSKTIKGGRMKDIGNPFRDMTEEEDVYLNSLIKRTHQDFIDLVVSQRPYISNLKEMTDGRFVDSFLAKENHLIDEIGTYFDALDYLIKDKLNLTREQVEIDYNLSFKKGLAKIFSIVPEYINLNISLDKNILEKFSIFSRFN